MEQQNNDASEQNQNYKTVTQTSEDTVICDKKVFYTRKGYMKLLKLSDQSLGSPYSHVKSGRAEQFNFFSTSFFRPI